MVEGVPEAGGTIVREAKQDEATAATLSDDEVHELAELGRRIEQHYGAPQDTEWAYDPGGRAWILQSRPVTTLGEAAAEPPAHADGVVSASAIRSVNSSPRRPGAGCVDARRRAPRGSSARLGAGRRRRRAARRRARPVTAPRAIVADSGLLDRAGFELWVMAEVPSVLFNLERYSELGVAGISIGSSDLCGQAPVQPNDPARRFPRQAASRPHRRLPHRQTSRGARRICRTTSSPIYAPDARG